MDHSRGEQDRDQDVGSETAIMRLTCGFAGRRRRASGSWMPGKRASAIRFASLLRGEMP